jgi:hypothetical protein
MQISDSNDIGHFCNYYSKTMATSPGNILITVVLVANGVYDLCCCFGILFLPDLPGFAQLSQLHNTMFSESENSNHPVIKRLLAYWLMTYGMVRTVAGAYPYFMLDIVAALTYFIEAFCFEFESRTEKTMIQRKVTFVSVFSFILGVVVILRPFGFYSQ